MADAGNKPKIKLFLLLISIILLANYSLYHIPVFGPVPQGAVLGSLLDIMVVIPLITYFLIIRKKYSLKYMGIVILAAYGTSYFIIPNHHFTQFSYLSYLIIASEAVLILVELYILFKVLTKLPSLIKEYRQLSQKDSLFLFNVKNALGKHLPGNRLAMILLTELSMLYYSMFTWKKKVSIKEGQQFTYHKKTSVNAVYIMLIHATILESIGLHYFLHQWNEIIAYLLLILNIYAVLYFLAEIHATRLTPYVLTKQHLLLQTGLSKSMLLPLNQIEKFSYYSGPEKFSKKELKDIYDARVMDFIQEKPIFEITLTEPHEVHLMYGLKRKVNRVILNTDDPLSFFQELQKQIINEKTVSH